MFFIFKILLSLLIYWILGFPWNLQRVQAHCIIFKTHRFWHVSTSVS